MNQLATPFKQLIFLSLLYWSCDGKGEEPQPKQPPPGGQDLGTWEQRVPMPTARKEIANATVQLDGKIYVFAGVNNGSISNRLEIYDISNNSWSAGTLAPENVWRASAAAANGKIYLFGGYQSLNPFPFNPSGKVFEYDPVTDSWTEKSLMPVPRGAATAVAVGNKIHLIGGANSQALSRHDAYDPALDSWTEEPPMSEARSGLTGVNLDGEIYVFGGYILGNQGVISKNTVEKFSNGAWTMVAPMPATRHGIDADVINMKIYVTGGSSTAPFTCLEFDPVLNQWREMESMLSPVSFMGTVSHEGFLYAIGGGPINLNRTDAVNLTRRFTPPQ